MDLRKIVSNMNERDSQVLTSPQGITDDGWLLVEKASVSFKSVAPGRLVTLQCAQRHHEDISMSRKVSIQTDKDPKKPVHADKTRPSAIINGFSAPMSATFRESEVCFVIEYVVNFQEGSMSCREEGFCLIDLSIGERGVLKSPTISILHLAMDGDRDGDPRWNTGLNSLGPSEKQKEEERPKEEQKEEEHEKGNQNRKGSDHPLIQDILSKLPEEDVSSSLKIQIKRHMSSSVNAQSGSRHHCVLLQCVVCRLEIPLLKTEVGNDGDSHSSYLLQILHCVKTKFVHKRKKMFQPCSIRGEENAGNNKKRAFPSLCEDLDYVLFPRCPVVRTSSFKNMLKSAGFWASHSSAHKNCAISTTVYIFGLDLTQSFFPEEKFACYQITSSKLPKEEETNNLTQEVKAGHPENQEVEESQRHEMETLFKSKELGGEVCLNSSQTSSGLQPPPVFSWVLEAWGPAPTSASRPKELLPEPDIKEAQSEGKEQDRCNPSVLVAVPHPCSPKFSSHLQRILPRSVMEELSLITEGEQGLHTTTARGECDDEVRLQGTLAQDQEQCLSGKQAEHLYQCLGIVKGLASAQACWENLLLASRISQRIFKTLCFSIRTSPQRTIQLWLSSTAGSSPPPADLYLHLELKQRITWLDAAEIAKEGRGPSSRRAASLASMTPRGSRKCGICSDNFDVIQTGSGLHGLFNINPPDSSTTIRNSEAIKTAPMSINSVRASGSGAPRPLLPSPSSSPQSRQRELLAVMSDVEENNFEGRESRSQSKSPTGTPARAFTWADQLIVVVEVVVVEEEVAEVAEAVDNEILTMIEDMIEAMTDRRLRLPVQKKVAFSLLQSIQIHKASWVTERKRQVTDADAREMTGKSGKMCKSLRFTTAES
ncbi:hypothetical protein U0070_018031 [Myodes glareolus]|uniref:Uncharacterized protein n=1 Tax=Myodes glareolus TaxID=447135 RepID=A0AAW0IJS9_MYOGA